MGHEHDFRTVERLATDLRFGDRRHIDDASQLLANEANSGDALQLLGKAVSLNENSGMRSVDRVQLEPNGDLVISDPYGKTANTIRFDHRAAVVREPNYGPPVVVDQPGRRYPNEPVYVEQAPEPKTNNSVKYGVAGAIAGAVSGHNSNDRVRNGVIGAIVGGVVGDVVDQNNQNQQSQRRR